MRGFAAVVVAALLAAVAAADARAADATLTVAATQWGVSSCFIGGTEGGTRFNVADLVDVGANTFRVYGGMSRWEWQDDDGVYGRPTIDEIKADASIVKWSWWDSAMSSPPSGTDYWWAVDANRPDVGWKGNARTIFQSLRDAGVRPVLTLRMTDNTGNPAWAQQLNPPDTAGDWNEWWEHVFATVYWLNVRNDYRVDDYEVHNEPNNGSQGWRGDLTAYYELVRRTRDAIDYVYRTYLPGRSYRVHAPTTTGGSSWPKSVLQYAGSSFDAVNVHDYDADVTPYVQKVHDWMTQYGHAGSQLWIGEWGTYDLGNLDSASFTVGVVVRNLIRMSRPGRDYVYGSHIFSFYDWSSGRTGQYENFDGLVRADGSRRTSFYGFRLASRALRGCRPTFQVSSSTSNLLSIATKDSSGALNLLMANPGSTSYRVTADLSALAASGAATVRRYSATEPDVIVASPTLSGGRATVDVPPVSAVLLTVGAAPADTTPPAAPLGLTAVASGASSIELDWPDSPEADLASYRVYRDGVRIAAPTASSFADTGLVPATKYAYQVTAVDAAGNESALSLAVVAVTAAPPAPDEIAPAAPTGLSAVASGSSRIDLDWADNVEADRASYRVYRDGVLAATTVASSYADTGLAAGTTYTYRVTAVDASGNESAPSAEAAATTAAAPPAPGGGGANLASGKTAIASSFHDTKFVPARGVDGDSGTRWWTPKNSAAPASEWLAVDLGQPYTIVRVVVEQGDRWATSYTIDVSLDGVSWTTVRAVTTGAKGIAAIDLPPTVARWVRFQSTAWLYSFDRVKLQELEVY